MSRLWKRIEGNVWDLPQHLEVNDKCFYARDYISPGGYESSETNQLIFNFKKSIDKRDSPEWYYKKKAIQKFADELSLLIPDDKDDIVVTCIPSSKRTDDTDYDSRLEETLSCLKKKRPLITIEYPLKVLQTRCAAHSGGSRSISTIYNNYEWVGFSTPPETVILIDDVITTGADFKACKRIILEHHSDISVIGIFWAKTVWP